MNQDRKRQAKQKKREREVRQKKLAVQAEAIRRSKGELETQIGTNTRQLKSVVNQSDQAPVETIDGKAADNAAARTGREEYPDIVIGRRDADPKFIDSVIEASKSFDFLDTKRLGEAQQAFYKMGKECGFEAAILLLHSLPSINYGEHGERKLAGTQKLVVALTSFGSRLLAMVPVETRKRYMPFNDVSVAFEGQEIILHFSSMKSQSGFDGRVYFNRLKPKIAFDGKEYTVGFSRHSIERICKRLNPRFIEYGPSGDIHAFFNSCVYFEPVMLFGNQPAFALYDWCDMPGFSHYETYTVGVLGKENVDPHGGRIFYKVGYCPVVFEGEFAKAKSFIQPGFRSTPEYGLLLNSSLPRGQKERLLEKVTDEARNEFDTLYRSDSEAAKWFHENGIPQVVQWKHDVFVNG